MKGKRLGKQICLALMLSSVMPMAAWADYTISEDGKTLTLSNQQIGNNDATYDGKKISDFENVIVTNKGNHGNDPYSYRLDAPNTNVNITINSGFSMNDDGIHLTNWGPHFVVKDYTATVKSLSSDALNLSHDATNPYAEIHGNLNANVSYGSGIRANASWRDTDQVAKITVYGTTNITTSASLDLTSAAVAAVFAGADTEYDKSKPEEGDNHIVRGKGVIDLRGMTTIRTSGRGNYSIWSGKHGFISVNSLDIGATGLKSFGVASTNGNITYGSDDSENIYGSSVILNGEKNVVKMAEGGKALYAEGTDVNGNSNSVKSGENGIGYINFTGDIEAENGGLIDLTVHGYENNQNILVGDIKAYGIAENTESIDEKTAVRLNVEDSLRHEGDALAADGGTVNVTLGNGSVWIGRADDYQDAADSTWIDEHLGQFESSFSGDVHKNGTVTVDMGTGSTWKVKGQSWITELKGNNSDIVLDGENGGSYAVHIGKIEGNNNFVVTLKPDDLINSDMIYVKDGTNATQHLTIRNSEDVLTTMDVGDKIRFATVANAGGGFDKDGNVSGEVSTFGRSTRINDKGMFDVDFDVVYESYATDELQGTTVEDEYNGGSEFSDSTAKPGTDYTDAEYGTGENPYNVYLVREGVTKDNVSDAGKTVIAMSKVNYSNAIYMDRLNKRMGEARYIDGDEGLWVRMRHDRIGKSDAFRSMNTMMELGYDTRVNDREDGEHRQGVAIDYMRGTADYKNVAGEGDVRRGGIWFYDTWLGNKGHYTDYVLKFGRLSNDFELYTRTLGEKVTGDYSNFVYSASAEYGRKKDLGNNWYIEPQAQIQYAHVTDADYTTSQDTHVQLDAIDSLIGRVGFRLGKDVGEKSTFYIKADVLHEFLGDQDIEARDATGLLSTTYENEGTWYDIGLGFSHQFSKGTYMYLDMEKSIGNDNEDTYQFNFGMNWKV